MISSWLGYTEKDTKEFLTVAGVIVEEDCIFPMKIEQERVNKTDRNEPILIFIDFWILSVASV